MRALIIDDEEQNILLLKAMLQQIEGLVTISTTDPTLAGELFEQHQPDLYCSTFTWAPWTASR
jgi:CheY-like chemotaxis protein